MEAYRQAQSLLYESLDPVAAARAYEHAASLDEGYLQAWVGLALAWTSMGTPDSLANAIDLWLALIDIPVGDDGVSSRCMGILLQNLAYTLFQQYLYTHDVRTLEASASYYWRSSQMEADVRPELYYPWCKVFLLLGRDSASTDDWNGAWL